MAKILAYSVMNGKQVKEKYKFERDVKTPQDADKVRSILREKHLEDRVKEHHDEKYANDFRIIFDLRLTQQERKQNKFVA